MIFQDLIRLRICFTPSGILRNEYNNLYQALFNNAELHQEIVAALAVHQSGITNQELLKKLGKKSNGSYQRAIEELVLSDFIAEFFPLEKKKRGTFYRLIDEYSIFYHRFIRKNKKYTPGIWQQLAESQSFKTWAGFVFENLCHKDIDTIKSALGIEAVYTEISSLRIPATKSNKGFQIDLIIDRKDDSINLCEIKFHSGPFTINKAYYQQLIEKRQRFIDHTKTKKQVFLTFITNHGIVQNDYANEIVDIDITLEDIF